jgi:hypothetical protein
VNNYYVKVIPYIFLFKNGLDVADSSAEYFRDLHVRLPNKNKNKV